MLTAGYDPYTGILELNDPQENFALHLVTLKLAHNNEDKIIDLFQDIKEKCDKNIYLICVKLGFNYKNQFRKKFIQTAELFNIQMVQFIERQKALLWGALTHFKAHNGSENIIWIFDILKNRIFCNVWERQFNDIWRFRGCYKQEMVNSTPLIKTKDLQALKQKVNPPFKNPLMFVCSEFTFNRDKFKRVFSNYYDICFLPSYQWSTWALNYGKYLISGKPDISETLLERNISVMIGDTKYIENGYFHYTPSEFSIKVPIEHRNQTLKVYEDNINTNDIVFGTEGIFEIILIVDINGIYSVKTECCQNEIKAQQQIDYDHLITSVQEATIKAMQEKYKKYYNMPPKNVNYIRNSNALGIDFGTTQCCAAVIKSQGPDCVVLDEQTALRTMPSYVAYDERNPKFGKIAIDRMRHHKKSTIFDIKRMLGKSFDETVFDSTWPFTVKKSADKCCQIILKDTPNGVISLSPEEVSGSILKHIKSKVDDYQHKCFKKAVIAIPSAFNEKQKNSLLKAAKVAGFNGIYYIPEPVAAAFSYWTEEDIPDHSKLLVFDFGGGTVDVCIVEVATENLKVLSFHGNYYLGGRDFDALLYTHFDGILKHKYNIDVEMINKKYALLQKCQDIKHTLSVSERHWLDVDDFRVDSNEHINITVQEFNSMAANHLTGISSVILSALKKANLQLHEINYVLQVGGSSRMPMIKKLLTQMFPASIHKSSNKPDWLIAEGAAIYAYYLEQEEM